MKIYISEKQPQDLNYIGINNVITMENTVLNSEATSIIVDNFLSCFYLHEIGTLLSKILDKARIGCDITIIEKDLDLVSLAYSRGDISTEGFNEELFSHNKTTKSVLNMELVRSAIEERIEVSQAYVDYSSRNFVISGRRLK